MDLFPETLVGDSGDWLSSAQSAAQVDGDYRWSLSRTWDPALPRVCWNCLNPSTADASINDPSVIRMAKFSRAWGFGGFDLVNIYPYRSPHPSALHAWLKYRDAPLGTVDEEKAMEVTRAIAWNWTAVAHFNAAAAMQIAAWGIGASPNDVLNHVRVIFNAGVDGLRCLGRNENGTPRHPHSRGKHRVPNDFVPVIFGITRSEFQRAMTRAEFERAENERKTRDGTRDGTTEPSPLTC